MSGQAPQNDFIKYYLNIFNLSLIRYQVSLLLKKNEKNVFEKRR